MIKKEIIFALKRAFGELDLKGVEPTLTHQSNSLHGDYSSNVALVLAKKLKQDPLELAKKIKKQLEVDKQKREVIEKIEVAGPGFINFWIFPKYLQEQISEIIKAKKQFGSSKIGFGKKARVEFVSANPTGPLHFGNARGGPIGDALASVLEFCGWKVLREYLDNDRGNQILELGKTLAAKAGLISAPEEELAYKGEYIKELAVKIKPQIKRGLSEQEIVVKAGELSVKILFSEIIKDCKDMGINFDYIVHESDLQKQAPRVLDYLGERGVLNKAEGALWFAPKNEFLKDREAVVIKSDGSYTYFTADVVYHKEKFDSGYDLVIDVFGSNTSGHVPKLKALAEVLGFDLTKFKVILYQFVRIKKGKKVVKMSKRAGNFVTAREVLEEVGPDALKFFILMHEPNSHIDFDLDLARKKSNQNPVYYVQYAHARISSIFKKAQRLKITSENLNLLNKQEEIALIKHLIVFPELIEDISCDFGVHRLTTYAVQIADLFHKFYEECQVLSGDKKLAEARLSLVGATQIVLKNTLDLLGIEAPERM